MGGLRLHADWRNLILTHLDTTEQDQARIAAQRKALLDKLAWQRTLLQDGDIDQAAYRAKKADIEAQLAELAPPQGTVDLDRATALLEDLGTVWAAADDSTRKEWAGRVFDAVYYDLDNPTQIHVQLNKALQRGWSALPRTCTTCGSDGIRSVPNTGYRRAVAWSRAA